MSYQLRTDRRKRTLSDWPNVIITITAGLLCWGLGYYHSLGYPLTVNDVVLPFWEKVCAWPVPRVVYYVAGLLFIVLIAFVIQRISDIERLIEERTRLAFLFFFMLMSTQTGLPALSATTIVLVCLVFMLYELFKAYQLPEATGTLFNVGVLIGFAGLWMPQVLWLTPLIWIGMYQFQALTTRSLIASLIGILITYWFVLAWCIWAHDFLIFKSLYSSLTDFDFFSIIRSFRYHHLGFILIVFLLFAAFFHLKTDAISNRVRVRILLSFLLNMSLWVLGLISVFGRSTDSFLAVLFLPVSVLMAYFFESMHKRIRFVLYYFVLLLSVLSFLLRLWIF